MRQKLFYLIKITSIILISCALMLELWYVSLKFTDGLLPHKLYPIWCLGSFALVIHLIEGVIAAVKAKVHDKNPITYGTYTFFVGFVGLWELGETASSEKINI